MAQCRFCYQPADGLIHRCRPMFGPPAPKPEPEDEARRALMMWDAGYDVHPVTVRLARAYLDLKAQASKDD